MKGFIIGLAVVVLMVGGGITYKVLSDQGAIGGNANGGISLSGSLEFAKAEPLTIPVIGGYKLTTVDLGEGPVPLLTIPLDTWGGYAALFAANGGINPSKDSLFYQKGKFAVQLVNVEDATEQLNGFATGRWPIIWAPMDSMPLLYDTLRADKRVAPKVLGLFDWSDGGDGILVRNNIKKAADLKGKIILTSSNTPFSFFLLWYLAQVGLSGNDVKVVWVPDGDKAVKMFKDDQRIAAWVSWTPYINDCTDAQSPSYVPDCRLLISSKDANQLIADLYIVRSDLLADKPQMMQAFVESMLEASASIGNPTYNTMAGFYQLATAGEAKSLLDDVHIANYPETKMFLDPNNPIGAHKVFLLAQEYYKQLGVLASTATFEPDRVIDGRIMAAIEQGGQFAAQKNTIQNSFNKKAGFDIGDLENQRVVLTNDVQLYFEAQKLDFPLESNIPELKQNMVLLGQVAEQSNYLATTVIKLIGHLDTAKVAEFKALGTQAFIEVSAQAKLVSKKRAEFVKSILVKQFGISADRIVTEGHGWDNPIDETDPAKNRRVEVKFISLE